MGFKSITGSSLLKPEDPFPIYLHYENAGYLFNDSEHTWLWEKVNRVIKDPFWMFWIKHFEACTYKGTYINTLSTFFEGRPCLLGKFPYFCHYAPEHPIFPNTKIILNPVQLNKKWNFAPAQLKGSLLWPSVLWVLNDNLQKSISNKYCFKLGKYDRKFLTNLPRKNLKRLVSYGLTKRIVGKFCLKWI